MPIPIGSNAKETKEFQALYDEYCKIAFEILVTRHAGNPMPNIAEIVAEQCHDFATAMLNERNKK